MQITILAIYLSIALFGTGSNVHAKRLPEVILNKCSTCHDYLSGESVFSKTRFVKTKQGRDKFLESLSYMPPGKKLNNVEVKQISQWHGQVVLNNEQDDSEELTSKEVAMRCLNLFSNGVISSADRMRVKLIETKSDSTKFCQEIVKNIGNDKKSLFSFYTFLSSSFPSYNMSFNNQDWGSFEVYDVNQVPLAIIYSFLNDKDISYIFKANNLFDSVRNKSSKDPFLFTRQYNKYLYKKDNLRYFYGSFDNDKKLMKPVPLVKKGALSDVKVRSKHYSVKRKCHGVNIRECHSTDMKLGMSLGGGVLGAPSYFISNNGLDVGEVSNTELRNHRRWSKRIINDFLCRKLPVIDNSLAKVHVKKKSHISFRRSKECMSCHVTLDGMAKLTSNIGMYYNNSFAPKVDLLDEDARDDEIYLQFTFPAKSSAQNELGLIAYNSITSEKKYNDSVRSLEELGKFLEEESDFYYCQASKMIEFIYGESIDIKTLASSEFKPSIDRFFKHRKLKKLLIDLIAHPSFSKL